MPNSININRKLWVFGKSNSDDGDSNQTTISIVDVDTDQRSPDFTVNKSFDEAFEKCFTVYLKNGSNIQDFDLCDIPKFLCERDVSDGLKWNISRLITTNKITRSLDEFDAFIRFVNLDKLERISLTLYNKSHEHGGRFGVLEKPAVRYYFSFNGYFENVFSDYQLQESRLDSSIIRS